MESKEDNSFYLLKSLRLLSFSYSLRTFDNEVILRQLFRNLINRALNGGTKFSS